jgi:diaminohydroxyphosphoribosylaminopyrimidine deaminase / 5-amino-6-(5-phosphoribosylamino)uracil reductase
MSSTLWAQYDLALLMSTEAKKAIFFTSPNPRVSCVIKSLLKLCKGHTQPRGLAHAEIMALRDASRHSQSVAGATAYVTLEPCSHYGRTPPCCNALIEAGIKKVVIAILDPNPLVSGRGVQMLCDAGVEVEVLPTGSPEAIASRELNIGFFSRMIRKTPWVRMKIAASLDGQTALADGTSQWITGADARKDGHAWRARSCAVLTGIGTVLADDPLLDVRHVTTPRQPHLVIVDSDLDLPLNAKLWSTLGKLPVPPEVAAEFELSAEAIDSIAGRAIYIYTASQNTEKKRALEALGAVVIEMPQTEPSAETTLDGQQTPSFKRKVDLAAMMLDLGHREINELHVEAGFKLNGSLLRAGVVDELVVYTAPKLLGAGMGMASLPELASLDQAVQLEFKSAELLGGDLRVVARLQGRDKF